MTKILAKSLVEDSDDQTDLDKHHQNFSPLKNTSIATTKGALKKQIVLLGVYLMTETRYFTASQVGHTIRGLTKVPQKKSTAHYCEEGTLNLILQLLLYKDKDIVKVVLAFIEKVFADDHILQRCFEFTTFWERVLYAGLRKGLAVPALRVLTVISQKISKREDKFQKQIKSLDRLFPAYVTRWLSTHQAEDSKFLLDFEHRSDAEMYWTEEMFDQMKDTIGQMFPMDLQNLEDYYAGRKKAMPKVRNPPVTVQIHYELPDSLLPVGGIFLNSLVDPTKGYDFSNRMLIKDELLTQTVDMLKKLIYKPDIFTSVDAKVVSHIRILSKTVLEFARAGRAKSADNLRDSLEVCGSFVDQWIKHAARVSVRGLQVSCDFTQILVDQIKTVCVLFSIAADKSDSDGALITIFQKVTQKLLKKMTVDRNKLTYVEFKLFKTTLHLESLLLKTGRETIALYFANMLNDAGTDIDFHLLHGLRFVSDHVDLLQASVESLQPSLQAVDAKIDDQAVASGPGDVISGIVAINLAVARTAQDAGQTMHTPATGQSDMDVFAAGILKVIKDVKVHKQQMATKDKRVMATHTVPKVLNKLKQDEERHFKEAAVDRQTASSKPIDLQYDIREFKAVKDSTNSAVLGSSAVKVMCQADMRLEASKKMIEFNSHILDVVSKLADNPSAIAGLVRDGLIYGVIELLLRINELPSLDKDDRLFRIALRYAGIVRKMLVWGAEATIKHFGEDKCVEEVALRGTKSNDIQEALFAFDEESLMPLVEMFRVLKKTLHHRFISKAINGFRSFDNEDYHMEANESFVSWLNSQTATFDPEFIWTTDYSKELRATLNKQTASIVYSRKANYSYYLDDFKSELLSQYTKVGGIYLVPLIMAADYQIEDAIGMLKRVTLSKAVGNRDRFMDIATVQTVHQIRQ